MDKEKLLRFQNSHNLFCCPKCGKSLYLKEQSLLCQNRHCFDISKYGYINLLLHANKQQSYDKDSFTNRRKVLEGGIYNHILKAIISFIDQYPSPQTILDCGCGEGFYARQIATRTTADVWAADISRESIQLAARSDHKNAVKWFVADVANLPIKSSSFDCILDVFTSANYQEFERLLKKDGYIIKIIPGNDHLQELRDAAKKYIKKQDYSNQRVIDYFEKHYDSVSRKRLKKQYRITAAEREALIHMTPLLFHVNKEQIDWGSISEVTIDAEMLIGKGFNQEPLSFQKFF